MRLFEGNPTPSWRINLVLFSLPELSQGRLEHFSFEPDTNTGTDNQGDNVGEEEGEDQLAGDFPRRFLLAGRSHWELGRVVLESPLFRRNNIGPGAPVPDEVRHEDLPVDVDVSELQVRVLSQLQAGTVGRRFGRVVTEIGRDSTAGATGGFSLSLA